MRRGLAITFAPATTRSSSFATTTRSSSFAFASTLYLLVLTMITTNNVPVGSSFNVPQQRCGWMGKANAAATGAAAVAAVGRRGGQLCPPATVQQPRADGRDGAMRRQRQPKHRVLSSWLSLSMGAGPPQPLVSQREAQRGVDAAVAALRGDKRAISELGRLDRVTVVLGYGSPAPGVLAVRFNASFKKKTSGGPAPRPLFSVRMAAAAAAPTAAANAGGGGRGAMVGQVKASLQRATGRLTSCSVFRDLGYGRSFELKV